MHSAIEETPPVTLAQLRAWFAVYETNSRQNLGATFRNVAAACGWNNVSNATQHLLHLRRKGYVNWAPNEARTVVATSRPAYVVRHTGGKMVKIPNRLRCLEEFEDWACTIGN